MNKKRPTSGTFVQHLLTQEKRQLAVPVLEDSGEGEMTMTGISITPGVGAFVLALCFGVLLAAIAPRQTTIVNAQRPEEKQISQWRRPPEGQFDLQVLLDGRPLVEYYARGKTYIEASKGAEYEIRVTNPTSDRVAVALSVDGLNTIDARHTTAWNSSKWVIEPYQTITIGGWQMSTERARRFYFTDERDSYGAKLGQTANLGVITAVIFRERRSPISISPPQTMKRSNRDSNQNEPSERPADSRTGASPNKSSVTATRDDEYAATGIGRSVKNDVRWVDLQLDSQPAAELAIRYEYYSALLKLGVFPRPYYEPSPIRRREDSRGFSPEPR